MGEVETVVINALSVSISRNKDAQPVVAGKAEKETYIEWAGKKLL